ncbi:MAG: helix-turn-helix domain-containing protein [Sphingomonas adhaesiva]|uniref:helix-turn-helix transcriptional regulator n=1 Tax=Sphingomonas adhaesiva TaxID=28212 RepID=UPI002FF64B3E
MTTARLLRETDAADYLGLAPKTLARWRWAGKGPSFHKLGSAVRYSVEELDLYISGAAVAR